MTDFSGLFAPFQPGRPSLPNRIVFPPIGLEVCKEGAPGEGLPANTNLASLEGLMRRFDRGGFDPVGVGRAMIAEPDFPQFIRKGQLDRLKPFAPGALAEALLPVPQSAS